MEKTNEQTYYDLAPLDEIKDGKEYINILNYAIESERIKNIAISGPYGSGKSSIINSYIKDYELKNKFIKYFRKNNFIKISMAAFDQNKINNNTTNEISIDEIELCILKQFFYKAKPQKTPKSRYKKLYKQNTLKSFAKIFFNLILSFIVVIFLPRILNFRNTEIKNISYIVEFIILSLSASVLIFQISNKCHIEEVKIFSNIKVESNNLNSNDIFNTNLDEIIYFFQATKNNVVFFEDLDRFENNQIFVHLRELNILLNNSDMIKYKPIKFVYAVKDDIFTPENRTKFFDFIIPVIPVVSSANSHELLKKLLDEAKTKNIEHNISDEFILDVCPYISDMRILYNIYNEFIVYKKNLKDNSGLFLYDDKMLAIIIFKNLYPKDFADVQDGREIIKTVFNRQNIHGEVSKYVPYDYLNLEFEENKLLVLFLNKGYIDKQYPIYINYFRGNILNKKDQNFILSIRNRKILNFKYKLDKVNIIISKLQEEEFMKKSIYNFDLLECLLDNIFYNSEKLDKFIEQLSDESLISWNFIDEFIDITNYRDFFISLLANQWPNMWNYISKKEGLQYERKIYYLSLIMDSYNSIQNLNINDCIKNFIIKDKNIIKSLEKYTSIEMINKTLEILDISLDKLEIDGTH